MLQERERERARERAREREREREREYTAEVQKSYKFGVTCEVRHCHRVTKTGGGGGGGGGGGAGAGVQRIASRNGGGTFDASLQGEKHARPRV